MSKHRDVPLVGRGWRALCSAVPLFLILATMIVVPPVAIAQEAQSTGATGASGVSGTTGATGDAPPVVTGPSGASGPSGTTGALGTSTITSDQADYNPGATVVLTGSEWQGDTTVHINVNDSIGKTWERNVDVAVADDGTISDTFQLPLQFVAVYDVTATGIDTDRVAAATFTDSTFDFQQCLNDSSAATNVKDDCDWGNGAINATNSIYTEGDSIPQRWGALIDVAGSHFVDFEVDFSKSDVYAYDFITNPKLTQDTDALLLPCGNIPAFLGATDCDTAYANKASANVQSDSFDSVPAHEYPNPRTIFVGSPNGLSGITVTQLGHTPNTVCFQNCGDSSFKFRVSFTTSAASQKVLIWFGGHIASAFDPDGLGPAIGWGSAGQCGGDNCGGSSISGSPYHIASDTFDGGSVPRKENQVSASGVEPPGTIVITKDALPNDAQNFSFTKSGGPGGTFTGSFELDDDSDPAFPNTVTFGNLLPGSYTVVEDGETGWSLTGLTCVTTVPNGDTTTTTLGTGTAVIDVDFSETITCTYTNTQQTGSITIVKNAVPNDAQNFEFDPSTNLQAANFFLDDDADGTLSNQKVFTGLPTGTYTVDEVSIPAGWSLTDIDCGAASGITESATGVSINLAPNANVTCTYTNTKKGSITIVKDADPNDAQDFEFDPTATLQADNFNLDDDAEGTLSNQKVFSNLLPGTYGVDEVNIPASWSLTDITCTGDTSGVTETSVGVSIALTAGQNVTCTYTNTKKGSITIVKDADPNDAQDFEFDPTATLQADNFNLDDDAEGTLSNQKVFSNLLPGTYGVDEVNIPASWSLTDITCTGDTSGVTETSVGVSIALTAGQNVTCTYTNTKKGSITIVKDADPNDAQDFEFDPTATLQADNFNLDDDAEGTLSNQKVFSNLLPGTYGVDEVNIPASWSLTDITCTGDTSGVTETSVGVSIALTAGQNVTCTYTNTKKGSITIVKDADPNDAQDFEFDPTATLQADNFNLDDDAEGTLSNQKVFSNLLPGTYGVDEVNIPASWSLTDITCTGDTSGVTETSVGVSIALTAGQNVTCTYTNTKKGSITIVKDADPNDAQDFEFDPTATLQADNFNLDDDAEGTLSNQKVFSNLLPGTYGVDEVNIPASWSLTDITCTGDTSGVTETSVGVSIALTAGQNVTCTYTNTKKGSITIVKDADPNDAQDFEFDPTATLQADNFNLDDDAEGTLSNQKVFSNLLPGTYGVDEVNIPASWSLTDITCTGDTSGVTETSVGVSIALTAGQNVTCTYTNTKKGSITIVKDADPNDAQDFEFDPTATLQADNFNLDDDAEGTLSNQKVFSNLLPGTYGVDEVNIPASWSLTDITCTGDTSGVTETSVGVSIALTAGQNVTCTYTNTKKGSITIVKDADSNDAQDFEFDPTATLQADNFNLDDDAEGTLSNQKVFSNLLPGTYGVDEVNIPASWSLTDITCTGDTSGVTETSVGVSIALTAGQNVTCTYTNTKKGSITIVKDADPNDAQDFEFDPTATLQADNFNLDDDAEGTLSNQKVFSNLLPGTYGVDEVNIPASWSLTDITCTGDTSGVTETSVGVSIALTAGQNVTCTYTNTKKGSITIVKDADPNDAQDFEFDPTATLQADNFNLDDDAEGTLSNQKVFSNLLPGTYGVDEVNIPASWSLTDITCTGDTSGVTETSVGVSIALTAGQNVTCTYTNTKKGSITIVKDADPNDAQDFEFDPTATLQADNFNLDDDAEGTLSNQKVFSNLLPGTYGVDEVNIPASWSLTDITCTGDTSGVTETSVGVSIALTAGQNVTCTYTNTKKGSITIVKDADPNDAQDFEFDPTATLQADNFNLDDDAEGTLSNQKVFSNLLPGTYGVDEVNIPASWSLTDITCTGDTSGVTETSVGVSIALTAGQNVTCTYTNTKKGSITIVKDADPNDAQDFEFDPTATLQADNFNLDDDAEGTLSNQKVFSNLLPGTYGVDEVNIPASWSLTDITCTGDTSGVTETSVGVSIALTAGQNVTCTYTNTKKGSITIVKDADPNDAQDFEFDPTATLQADNFNLDDDAEGTLSNQKVFSNLLPGTYGVDEVNIPASWSLTDITCTGDTSGVTETSVGVSIALTAGQNVTCTYTNVKDATVKITKVTDPASDPEDFGFTNTGTGLDATATLDTDATSVGTPSSVTYTLDASELAGTKTITEDAETGWSLTTVDCTGVTETPISRGASFTVAAGATIECTFTNVKSASLDIEKKTVGGTGSFNYTVSGSGLASFSRSTTAAINPSQNAPFPFTSSQFDDKYVKETLLAGWTLTNIACTPGGAEIVIGTGINGTFAAGLTDGFNPGDTTVKATITAGDTPSCEFENTKNASLDIEKLTSGGTGTFSYTVSGSALVDFTRNTAVTNPTQNTPFPFTPDQFGDKFVKETTLAGWTLSNITCTAGGAEIVIGTGINGTFAAGATTGFDPGDTTVKVTITAGDTPNCVFTNTRIVVHPGTIGFWKNWRNHYTSAQIQLVINKIKTDNPLVYNKVGFPLTIAVYDAIFNYGNGTPRDQQILGQLTGLKSNLAITILDPNPPQKNDDICRTGVVNVSGISGATAYFGTATPTVGQVVDAIESKWTGNLTTNRNNWSFNLTNSQKTMFIEIITGINEGTIVVITC